MLTPEQVAEIRDRTKTIKSATIACDVFELLSDRAEIAAELQEALRDLAVLRAAVEAAPHGRNCEKGVGTPGRSRLSCAALNRLLIG